MFHLKAGELKNLSWQIKRGLIFAASHIFKQLTKPVSIITLCDQIKNVKQILCESEYHRVNWPLEAVVYNLKILIPCPLVGTAEATSLREF